MPEYLIGEESQVCPACGRKDRWSHHRRGLCLECFCYVVNHLGDFKAITQRTTADRAQDVMTMPQEMFDGIAKRMGEIARENPDYWKGKYTRDEEHRISELRGGGNVKSRIIYTYSSKKTDYSNENWAPIPEYRRMRTVYTLSEDGMAVMQKAREVFSDGAAYRPRDILDKLAGVIPDRLYEVIRSMFGHGELLRKRIDGQTSLYKLNPDFNPAECKGRPRRKGNQECAAIIERLAEGGKPFDLYAACKLFGSTDRHAMSIFRSRLNRMVTEGTMTKIKKGDDPIIYQRPKKAKRRKK